MRARTCRGAAGRAVIIPVDGRCTIGLEVIELDDVDATRRVSDHPTGLSKAQTGWPSKQPPARSRVRACVRVCECQRENDGGRQRRAIDGASAEPKFARMCAWI